VDEAQFELHADVEQQHWWFVGRRAIMRRVLGCVVPPGEGRLVIDVGCGTGGNVASVAGDYEAVGIDTSERGIELARRRFPGVEFRCGVAPADLGDLADRASVVLLMDVLEHVEDDVSLLRAQVEAITPGAFVLITVPADMRLWSEHDESFGHYRRYDEAMLRRIWTELPVRERLVSYYNSRLYPMVRLVRTVTRMRGKTFGQAGTDLSMPPGSINGALASFFGGEAGRLVATLQGRRARGYRYGVSLMAVLERVASSRD